MGFLDKAKEVAEQAKGLAGEAAERAKQEAKELQLKRELGQAHEELGKVAFELAETGAIAHPELDPTVGRIRRIRSDIAELAEPDRSQPEAPSGADPL
jgi:hypothetical protein